MNVEGFIAGCVTTVVLGVVGILASCTVTEAQTRAKVTEAWAKAGVNPIDVMCGQVYPSEKNSLVCLERAKALGAK